MEIKFIWIEKYKNIKNTGFNFSHSSNIGFQYIDDEIVIIEKQEQTPPHFYKKNITGVTAIVGKNGSGKTNLIEFINFHLAHVTNGGLATYFKGYKGILIIDKFIFYQEDLKIKNIDFLKNLGYDFCDYIDAPLDKQGGRKWYEMSKNKYIYYSPAFEFRYINMRDNLSNISTSFLAFNDFYYSIKSENQKETYGSRNEIADKLSVHYVSEKIRESDFILNYDTNEFIGESPTNLTISIDNESENKLLKRPFFYNETDEKKILEDKLWSELSGIENDNWNSSLINEFFNFKVPKTDETTDYDFYEIPIFNKKSLFKKMFFVKLFKLSLNSGKSYEEGFFRSFIYDDNLTDLILNDISSKLEALIDLCDWKLEKIKVPTERRNLLDLIKDAEINLNNNKAKKIFSELLDACKEYTDDRLFFHYQFKNNYSSGQQKALSFYSRFYWAKNEMIKSENEIIYEAFHNRIVIFIDEGEVALHPEWQRTFFRKSIDFLSKLFNDREIQLIFTTHSPFVLSDIPKNDVLFLDRDANRNLLIADMEKEKTFGSNIYTLLSDSFFMENTIGEFAHNKMKLALENLTKKDYQIDDKLKSELRFTIDSIGEPLLKEQFDYLYNQKFGNDETQVLKQRIIDLENQIKKTEDDNTKN
jgi:predicted ATPase